MNRVQMIYGIKINIGVGSLQFGMEPQDFADILDIYGDVKIRSNQFDGLVQEFRTPSIPICFYIENKLSHISMRCAVIFFNLNEIELFEEDYRIIMLQLSTLNGGAKIFEELFHFENLGLGVRGYFDVDTQTHLTGKEKKVTEP